MDASVSVTVVIPGERRTLAMRLPSEPSAGEVITVEGRRYVVVNCELQRPALGVPTVYLVLEPATSL